MTSKPLTAKQQAFVQEYLIDWNATQAAIKAGYAENSARQEGTRLLSNAYVSAVLKEKKRELAEKTDLKTVDVIYETMRLKDLCMKLDDKGKPIDGPTAARCLDFLGTARSSLSAACRTRAPTRPVIRYFIMSTTQRRDHARNWSLVGVLTQRGQSRSSASVRGHWLRSTYSSG